MALFSITRYAAEEEEEEEAGAEAQERARVLLERLREQARARQLRRQEEERPRGAGGEPAAGGEAPSPGSEGRGRPRGERRAAAERAAGGSAEPGGGEEEEEEDEEDGGAAPTEGHGAGGDSEEDVKQQEDKRNLKNKSKRKKRDEETKGAERKKARSEGAEGNQSTKEELPLAASGEEATPPPSSLVVLGDYDRKPVQKVQPFLPQWLAQPKLLQKRIKENLIPVGDVPGIHPKLLKKLQMNGIESFFPVQAEVIPAILQSASNGYLMGQGGYRPKDICVSAPTGSGKTLSFVIPIIQVLLDRVVCQVRALVVLPTKELAQQVSKVFNIYTDGTGLKVVLITGQKSFAKEQEMLVQKKVTGYRSLADIIVATPGRLADHISKTPGFNLTQLRFLIIDEADRMIDDMHQNWLNQVVKAAFQVENDSGSNTLFQRTKPGPVTAASCCYPQIPLQKLLFSATLTQDPEKLQQLGLFQPRLFTSVYSEKKPLIDGTETEQDAEEKYTLPEGLSQCYVPCDLNSKPLLLLHFMLTMKFTRVLCFTNSREASHRLFLLVQAFGGITVAEFSSRLPPNERQRTMKEFEQGKIQLLISTDATARGIDIKGVNCVINYDAPQFIRAYIHRVGRTARAGKAGLAFSMVLRIQERRFLRMLKDAGIPDIKKHLVKGKSLKPLVQQYEEALSKLEKTVKGQHRTEEFRKVNMLMKVPALKDGSFTLAESIAILLYLARKFKTPDHWYPADLQKRAKVDEYLSWQHVNIRGKGSKLFLTKVLLPLLTGQPLSPEKLEGVTEELNVVLKQFEEKFLQDKPFIVGNEISLADLVALVELMQPVGAGYNLFEERPKLAEWRSRVEEAVGKQLCQEAHEGILNAKNLTADKIAPELLEHFKHQLLKQSS